MLRALTVHDFVIVDSMELDFSSGFSALTGETGAGKSILIDALQLTLGGRGDSSVVREGASKADIGAEFSVNEAVTEWLRANEIDAGDDSVLIRRTIDSSGRSRGFINGVAVTTSQMRELASLLVDIHGQHAHQLLLKQDEQRLLLDRHAGLQAELEELSIRYRVWQALSRQIEEVENDSRKILAEKEHLEWQVNELEKLDPKEGEWERVNSDYDRLSHAASLIEGAGAAVSEIVESDQPVLSRLHALEQNLSKLTAYDQKLAPVVELLESAKIQLQEASYALKDYLSRADLDPGLLNTVEKRMEALHSASRQFMVQPESLHAELSEKKAALQKLGELFDIDGLRKQEAEAQKRYFQLAETVSRKRREAAKELSDMVTSIMEDLHMSGGRFSIEVSVGAPHAYGVDQVEFLVAGHAGTTLRPLAKVASGGELARISLAISVIASKATATPTLIFDEVDSGVGGAVAEVVGRLLKKLGKDHQVLCVTHLPQVASQANRHFQVSKVSVDKVPHPVSRIVELADDERIQEIARMLGGVEITDATLNHARSLETDAVP